MVRKASKGEISTSREKFISDYCKKRGWNPSNLSPSQLIEIVQQKDYKRIIR